MRFKKLFSTDEIIERTRSEMENLLRDMNNNAARNIDLLEDRIQQLRSVVNEADRKIKAAENELNLRNVAADIHNKIENSIENYQAQNTAVKGNVYRAAENYRKTMGSLEALSNSRTASAAECLQTQGSFAETNKKTMASQNISDKSNGIVYSMPLPVDAGFSVPPREQKITFAEYPIVREKTLSEKVAEFAKLGLDADYIAKELSCSKTEVELIMSLSNSY